MIRDPLGTGLGAKPICNTDVFCVAPPDTPGDYAPRRRPPPAADPQGVVAGVRDYGNRMGIPPSTGPWSATPAYLANPLVFCGTVGVIPRGMSAKSVEPGDRIVAIGGRTGRDGIHGATFSSVELTGESESISGGAVQIGNAIAQKMVLDVVLRARDRRLFRSITDCGAGGFSSAVGEMGAETRRRGRPRPRPAQVRRALVHRNLDLRGPGADGPGRPPRETGRRSRPSAPSEGVEATDLGRFVDTGRLTLRYQGEVVGDLAMDFLHDGPARRRPQGDPAPRAEARSPSPFADADFTGDLLAILGTWDVCSKEWIVRQYDHEVQARTVDQAARRAPSTTGRGTPR